MKKAQEVLTGLPVNQKRLEAGKKPANSIWLWGQGKAPSLLPVTERFGLRGSVISAVDLTKGIGAYAGLEIVNVPGATGYLDTNYGENRIRPGRFPGRNLSMFIWRHPTKLPITGT
jgi:2,3-bisphosphoglycerate-independent phosphoglycerate mutase